MKMKLMEVLVRAEQMNLMAQKNLPIKLSYAIGKNRDRFMEEYRRYDEERKKLCENYAEKDKDGKPVIDGNNYKLTDEARAELDKALEEFRSTTEVDIEVYKCSKSMDELIEEIDGSSRYDTLSANDLKVLDFLLEE